MSLRDQMSREQLIAASHIKNIIGIKEIQVISNQKHDLLMKAQATVIEGENK
jgi:hypothetical protein